MSIHSDIRWFKQTFLDEIIESLSGSQITPDLLCAIAAQETRYIWSKLLEKKYTRTDILRLCVGDTIESPRRKAFPKNKAALLAEAQGPAMFEIARRYLREMSEATEINEYRRAYSNPNKFVHGFGIFQRDLQYFKEDKRYFLDERWSDFEACLSLAINELERAIKQLGYSKTQILSNAELAFCAIVYNTGIGNFKSSSGLKQGFEDENGIFYGEHIARYLKLSQSIEADADSNAATDQPLTDATGVPPAGKYQVNARPTLNLRGGPATTFDVKKEVENGTFVTVLGFVDGQHGKWALIDLEDDGVRDGFVFASYLAPSS